MKRNSELEEIEVCAKIACMLLSYSRMKKKKPVVPQDITDISCIE